MNRFLADTNSLIYYLDADSPHHTNVASYFQAHRTDMCISSQNILESCAVLVHKYNIPLSIAQTSLRDLIQELHIHIIYPNDHTFPAWISLCNRKKRTVFDSFLVATMISNDIHTIYTENARDFRSFSDIDTIKL